MQVGHVQNSEVSILNRILRPDAPTFSREAAQDILSLDFDQFVKDCMRELSAKARAGTLTAKEEAESGKYELVGHLLNVMQSKARRSHKNRRGGSEKKRPSARYPARRSTVDSTPFHFSAQGITIAPQFV